MSMVEGKLKLIARLSAGELQGWWQTLGQYRPQFDGERAALLDRAKSLGANPAAQAMISTGNPNK